MRIVLASGSPYRKELMERLMVPFDIVSPDVDESRFADEDAEDYVKRLALKKAHAAAEINHGDIFIGSDQCAINEGQILGKPGNYENAFQQLKAASGKCVSFYTSLCVVDHNEQRVFNDMVPYHVYFRNLKDEEIERYLDKEQPYNCAGSFKSEGLGSSLFRKLEGEDPTALIGLPLIKLTKTLRGLGVQAP